MKTVEFELFSIIPSLTGYCKGFVSRRSGVENGLGAPANLTGVSVADDAPSPSLVPLAGSVPAVSSIADVIPCDGQLVCPPSLPHRVIPGLDWLDVAHWVRWADDSDFLSSLDELKNEFYDDSLGLEHLKERPVVIADGLEFNLSRFGNGKQSYVLRSDDLWIFASNHDHLGNNPNLLFRLTSKSCWNPGWQHVYENIFLPIVKHYKGEVVRETVSRVDLTVDIANCKFYQTDFINQDRWVSRSRKCFPVYDNDLPESIRYGKDKHSIQCYDKTNELKQNSVKKEFFENLWLEILGYVPEDVTRVECRVHREPLRSLGINTYSDLKSNLNSLWQYCVGSPDQSLDSSEKEHGWARFLAKPMTKTDREYRNHSKYAVDDLWTLVQSADFNQEEVFTKLKRVKKKKKPFLDVDKNESTILGLLTSHAAAFGVNATDHKVFLSYSFGVVKSIIDRLFSTFRSKDKWHKFVAKFEAKRNLFRPFQHEPFDICHDYGIDPFAYILNPQFSSS